MMITTEVSLCHSMGDHRNADSGGPGSSGDGDPRNACSDFGEANNVTRAQVGGEAKRLQKVKTR